MANIKLLCLFLAGIGYHYGNPMLKMNKNSFKVYAQPIGRQITQPARPDIKSDTSNIFFPQQKSQLLMNLSKFGMPVRDELLDYYDFEMSYDNRTKQPNWVAEHLTLEDLKRCNRMGTHTQNDYVNKEERVHCFFQSNEEDYRGHSYEKGFLVAGNNHLHSQISFKQSSILSNVSPMSRSLFQSETWYTLEAFVRYLTSQYADIYVFTGPIFISEDGDNFLEYEVIGDNNVAVPTHFFKIIIARPKCEGRKFSLGCYLVPNKEGNGDITKFKLCLADLEKKAGFKMFEENFRPFEEDLITADRFVHHKCEMMAEIGLTYR